MPNLPAPFRMRSWKQVAANYDRVAFNHKLEGKYLPLIWWDKQSRKRKGFGLPSYIGHPGMTGGPEHEAINCIGAVISASLVDIDKADQNGVNYVLMCDNYFDKATGIYLNKTFTESGLSFWYELFPNVAMFELMSLYPDIDLRDRMKSVANELCKAVDAMRHKDNPDYIDFKQTAFDFAKNKPVKNGKWVEPDASAAFAFLEYLAWSRFEKIEYLDAAKLSLDFLEAQQKNPFYELFMPFGAYIAARMNAEIDTGYDVEKFVNWCFEPSDVRYGWGVTQGNWNGYDCSGLVGSTTHGGGYGFAMNTFVAAGKLVPLVRYDERFAGAIGKWMLNAANTTRFLYANGLDPENQTCYEWARKYDKYNCFTYEGLRKKYKNKSPMAMGDPLVHGWANTDFALYGSSWSGIFGGIIEITNYERILKLDCLKTDPWSDKSYPTYLLYNPYQEKKVVEFDVGAEVYDIYEVVSNQFISHGVSGNYKLSIDSDSAVVLVIVPHGSEIAYDKHKTLANNTVIDFNNGRDKRSTHKRNITQPEEKVSDKSISINAEFANITVDGDPSEWRGLKSEQIICKTSDNHLTLKIHFAWNKSYLYGLVLEKPGDQRITEPADTEEFVSAPWNFDAVSLFIDIDNSNNSEPVGDFNLWLGLSKKTMENLFCARSHRPQPLSREYIKNSRSVSKKLSEGLRVCEFALSWDDIEKNVNKSRLPDGTLKKNLIDGFRFGCEPLVVDDSWRTQYFIGGQSHPTGACENSRDIVLIGK
jgi:hypothetical protein